MGEAKGAGPFRELGPGSLEFRLAQEDEGSRREVIRFSDPAGPGAYRLNVEKCACLPEEALGRLARYGVLVSDGLRALIEGLRKERLVCLAVEGGDLVITATPSAAPLLEGMAEYEPKTGSYRALPSRLWDIVERLSASCRVSASIDLEQRLSFQARPRFRLREYQARAYEEWAMRGFRGVISLPTAAGKTFLGLQAIADLAVRTLIIVPTIDLLYQWRRRLTSYLGIKREDVGVYGGGSQEVKEITVITYSSAYLNAEGLSDKFMLLIADEAHHAAALEYRRIFDLSIARYRMGLTGTPLRSDGLHRDYELFLGPIIQPASREELEAEGYIAGCDVERLYVELEPRQMEEYRRQLGVYEAYCNRLFGGVRDPRRRFQLCLRNAARDPAARDALRARHRARVIALSAERKVEAVGELLKRYGDRKVLIFSRYVDVVRAVSRRYLIPLIVAETSNEERAAVLEMFRRGEVTKLASGMTLEEGIDVPDAEVGIVISGSGSNREFLQRIGRLLRPKKGRALLVELVTKGTMDQALSQRRKKFREWA